jgi:hypothetical protein
MMADNNEPSMAHCLAAVLLLVAGNLLVGGVEVNPAGAAFPSSADSELWRYGIGKDPDTAEFETWLG